MNNITRQRLRLSILKMTVVVSIVGSHGCAKKNKNGAEGDEAPSNQTNQTNPPSKPKSKSVDLGDVNIPTSQLILAGSLSIIPPKDGEFGLRLAGSDYENDRGNLYVRDDAFEALDQASGIYCFINQFAYGEMVNKGPYLAQVDNNKCFKNHGGGASNDNQAGAKELISVVVEATREENKPLMVKFWLSPEPSRSLFAQLKVAEGSSKNNPIGIFRLEWNQGGNGGKLESLADEQGRIVVSMHEDGREQDRGSSWSMAVKAVLDRDETKGVTGGKMRTKNVRTENNQTEGGSFAVAFNDGRLLKKPEQGAEVCLSRDDFHTLGWNYNVYEASTGKRVELNSGFPIEYTSNGQDRHGHIGYHGLWTESGEALPAGTTIRQVVDYRTQATKRYTIVRSNGKLMKNTRIQLSPAEMMGLPLNWFDNQSGKQWRIEYNGSKFQKTGEMQQGNRESKWQDVPPVDFTLQQGNNVFWSEGLGSVDIGMSGSTLAKITITKSEDVTGSTADLTLKCLYDCPVASITSSMLADNNSSPFSPKMIWGSAPIFSAAVDYTFSASDFSLKRGGVTVAFDSGVNLKQSQQFQWGIQSGPMLPSGQASGSQAFSDADVYYTWHMGQEPWSYFTGLRDENGQMVKFDAPLQFTYTHSEGADADGRGRDYFGKTLRMNYGGPGQFWGIPSEESEGKFWMPVFSIKNGTLAGPNNIYKLKMTEGEQRMKVTSSCDGLALSDLPDLPETTGYGPIQALTKPDETNLNVMVIDGEYLGR